MRYLNLTGPPHHILILIGSRRVSDVVLYRCVNFRKAAYERITLVNLHHEEDKVNSRLPLAYGIDSQRRKLLGVTFHRPSR